MVAYSGILKKKLHFAKTVLILTSIDLKAEQDS